MAITTNLAKGVFVYSAKENKKKEETNIEPKKTEEDSKHIKQKYSHTRGERIARVPGEKP